MKQIEYKNINFKAIRKTVKDKGLAENSGLAELIRSAENLDATLQFLAADLSTNGVMMTSQRGSKANPALSNYMAGLKELNGVLAEIANLMS